MKKDIYMDTFVGDVDKCENEFVKRVERTLLYLKGIGSVYYNLDRKNSGYVQPAAEQYPENVLPLPPDDLRQLYGILDDGTYDDHRYLESGRLDHQALMGILAADAFSLEKGCRIFELGCSSGRFLRWFYNCAENSELWGCDVDAESISWAQTHLSQAFNCFLSTTGYHLPFSDGYFNLSYAGSVFTHIGDLADAWLLELRRVTSKDGRVYITINDEQMWETIQERWPDHPVRDFFDEYNDKFSGVFDSSFAKFVFGASPKYEHVVYRREELVKKLEVFFKIKSISTASYGYQSGYLLQPK